jgi:hypothetical protein
VTAVRLATKKDEDELMGLCKELHEDNGLFSFNEDMVRGMLGRAFERRGGIIGAIDHDGKIAGCIYLLLSNFWYSQDHHLEELFSYIRPPFRKSSYATDLIVFAEHCAKTLSIPLVIGVLTSKRMEAKVRLYSRKLGNPAGAFFVVNSKWDSDGTTDFWHMRNHTKKKNGASELLSESTTTTSVLPLMPVVS